MINEYKLKQLCNKYGIEYQIFHATDTILIDAKLDIWEVKYYEEIQKKLNLLYNKQKEIQLQLLSPILDEPIKKKILYEYEKINKKIKETKPYYLLHKNKSENKFSNQHRQNWKRNLYQVITFILAHKRVLYGIHYGSPYIHKHNYKINNKGKICLPI